MHTAFSLIAGVAIGAVSWQFIGEQIDRARLAADDSARVALFVEAKGLLTDYKARNETFPDSLSLLRFSFPDGGDSRIFDGIIYTKCGTGYIIGYVPASGGPAVFEEKEK